MLLVYVGYPGIPFINFDQVVLPKYEANAKMGKRIKKNGSSVLKKLITFLSKAALGPFARQKNGIITPVSK